MTKSKIIDSIIISFFTVALAVYLAGCFIFADFNCANWPIQAKVISTSLGLFLGSILTVWIENEKRYR